MTLFENPLQLAKQVRDLHAAVARWQLCLRLGEIDDTGPFIGTPAITRREAFREIAEQKQPPTVTQAWTRWAFRLTEARVNAPLLAAMARAYRLDRHQIERPEPEELPLTEMLRRALCRPHERHVWLGHLENSAAVFSRLSLEQSVRRDELARRAGFASADEISAPADDLPNVTERLLCATDDVYRELVPTEFGRWLETALASNAIQGWPAQLSPRAIQSLLGDREWLNGLDLSPRVMPAPIAPASYARGLYQLGSALLEAAVPQHEPFVTSRDPYGLARHAFGALCAQLTGSARWQSVQLSLSRADAAKQARGLRISHLIAARVTALAVLSWDRSRRGAVFAIQDYEELSHRALGFALPAGLCGVFPRFRADSGQRLVGQWLASRWNRDWIESYDEDWFRNPRGIEALRDRASRPLPTRLEPDDLTTCQDAFVRQMHELT